MCIAYTHGASQTSHPVIDALNDSVSYDYIVSHPYAAVTILGENLQRARKEEYLYGEGKALSLLGLAYYFQGKYDASAECYTQAMKIFEDLEQYKDLAVTYGEYGYQLKRRDLDKAEHFMRMAIGLALTYSLGDELLCKLYDNYGVLKEMRAQYDSATYFYQRALYMKERRGDTYGIPYSLNKLAGLHMLQEKYSEARLFLLQSDKYRAKEHSNYGRADNSALWGDFYARIGMVDSAITSYKYALTLAQQYTYSFLVEYCYQKLSEMYAQKGQYRTALEYFQRYTMHKDSTHNIQARRTIAELEIAYETAQKDKLLAAKEFELRQQRFWIVLGSIIALVVISSVIASYQYQRKKHAQEKRELELQAKLREVKFAESLANEKVRISRELHDNIGARITFIINALETLMLKKYEELQESIRDVAQFSRETLEEVRNTIWAIKSNEGTLDDLVVHIRKYVQRIQPHLKTMSITFIDSQMVPCTLTSLQMLNIFRMVQEALQNAIKHSGATEVTISIQSTVDDMLIQVVDNGKGFIPESVLLGNGIFNMRTRCEEIGAHFSIESSHEGTKVLCHLRK
ncbi:MAG: histidine kinase [Bacteroidetes bacterium]|nr:histidine kinase [Bacteroidota bacterium]